MLFEISIEDPIEYKDGDIGILKRISLVPNGVNNPEIVAVLIVHFASGRRVSATSNHFKPVAGVKYKESYPTVNLSNS